MAIDGTYNITVDTPIGKQETELTLRTDGESLSGSSKSSMGSAEFSGGKVNDDNFEFEIEINGPMGMMKLTQVGMVKGNDISGEVKSSFGSFRPFIPGKKSIFCITLIIKMLKVM